MDLDYLSLRIKELKEFENLGHGEIKAWLCRVVASRDCNNAVKEALHHALTTISKLNSKMPEYWHDSAGESEVHQVMENLRKVQQYIS
jgi:hypothetical protein